MQNDWDAGFSARRKAASDAKKNLFGKYRDATSGPDLAAKLAERQAIAAARDERRAERERLKAEQQEALRAEAAERAQAAEAAALAEAEQRQMAEKNRIARVIEDQAARKAERDRRYAERKARNRG